MASPAWGAAAGTVGQLLMQYALDQAGRREREQERKGLADYRQKQLGLATRRTDISELGAMMGPGETAAPFTPDMEVPKGARTSTIGDRSYLIRPPPPKPSEPVFRATATRPAGSLSASFATPDQAAQFQERFGVPEPSGTRAPTPSEQLSSKRFAVQNALGYAESLIREPRPGGGPGITFEEMVPELRSKFPMLTAAEAGGIASRANQNVGTERLTPVGQPVDRYGVGTALDVPPPPPRPFEKAAQQRGLLEMVLNRDRPGVGAPSASGVAGETAAPPPRRRLAGPRPTGGGSAPAPQGQGAIVRPPVTVGLAGAGSQGQGAIAAPPGTPRSTPSAGAPGPQELISAQGLIRAARAQGMDDSSIRERLVRAEYTDAEIAELLGR